MPNCADLATLQAVKQYLYSGQPNSSIPSSDDPILAAYLTAVSSWIARYLGRVKGVANLLLAQAWIENRNGNGSSQMRLRARPISSVSGVLVGQASINSAQGMLTGAGYVFDPDYVMLRGAWAWNFWAGHLNVQFQYVGGYNTPGMGAVAALPDWSAATLYPTGFQINHVTNGIVYLAVNGGLSGATAPAFPTALGAQVADGTGINVGVQSIAESGTIVTVTTIAPHGLSPNQAITISSVNIAGYNGAFTVQTTPSPTTFTYVAAFAGLGAGGGGVVTSAGLAWQALSQVLPLMPGAPALPQELTLATVQETALVYKERGHIGDKGTGIPGGVTYMIDGISKGSKMLLAPHVDYAAAIEGGEIVPAYASAA